MKDIIKEAVKQYFQPLVWFWRLIVPKKPEAEKHSCPKHGKAYCDYPYCKCKTNETNKNP